METNFLANVLNIFFGWDLSNDLQVGSSVGAELVFMDCVKLGSVPFKTRTKNVFYNNKKNKPIKGITVTDLEETKAYAIVTSGGVGSSFVNIRLKGQRGKRLKYQIMIYA